MIQQRLLGRTGLQVSELCLGTMNFGWKTDEAASFDILDAFYAAGGNFIQASAISPVFSLPSASTHVAEEIVGRWMSSRRIPRHRLILGTRISLRPAPSTGMSLARLTCERTRESMRRLNTDYLDLLVFEWNEQLLPATSLLEAFDAAIRQCFVRYIGASNFPTWRVADLVSRAFRRNQSRMEVLQGDYSLMRRARYEPEAMSLCEEQRLGFIATSPLAGGFLTSKARERTALASLRDGIHRRFDNSYGDMALSALWDVAARYEASPAQVALAWVLQNRTVTSAMVGARSAAEMNELAAGSQLNLSPRDFQELTDATEAEEVRVATPGLLTRFESLPAMAN